MSLADTLNPQFTTAQFDKIMQQIRMWQSLDRDKMDEEVELSILDLFQLKPFEGDNWVAAIKAKMDESVVKEKKNPEQIEFYPEAIEKLKQHIDSKNAQEKGELIASPLLGHRPISLKTLVGLYTIAQHLSFYEADNQSEEEEGIMFKFNLADNADPKVAPLSSMGGYIGRFRQYAYEKIISFEDVIRQKLSSSATTNSEQKDSTPPAPPTSPAQNSSPAEKPQPAITPQRDLDKRKTRSEVEQNQAVNNQAEEVDRSKIRKVLH